MGLSVLYFCILFLKQKLDRRKLCDTSLVSKWWSLITFAASTHHLHTNVAVLFVGVARVVINFSFFKWIQINCDSLYVRKWNFNILFLPPRLLTYTRICYSYFVFNKTYELCAIFAFLIKKLITLSFRLNHEISAKLKCIRRQQKCRQKYIQLTIANVCLDTCTSSAW